MPPKKVIVKRGLASYDNGVIDVACPHPRCQQPAGKRCMNTAGGLFAQTAHRARVIAAFKKAEDVNVIDGEVVDAEGTSIGDRRGAEAAERVLDSSHGGRLAIQAPRDRGDDHPEASSAAE